jgi:hypothetical protein
VNGELLRALHERREQGRLDLGEKSEEETTQLNLVRVRAG